jgi:hypothetical protein
VFTAHIGQSHAAVNLAQHTHDLGVRKSALPHQNLLVLHSGKILPSKPLSLREDYHPIAIPHVSGARLYRPRRRFLAAESWGLELFADPDKTAIETDVFWLPNLLTHVVSCQCRAENDTKRAAISLSSFLGRRAVLAGLHREHVAFSTTQNSATLVIEKGTFLFGKSAITFTHEGLCSAASHFATMQVLIQFTVQETSRLKPLSYSESKYLDYLIALDGHLEGRSHREIAIILLGQDVVEANWNSHTDWLKSKVRRAIRRGKALMNGGYRKLL